MEDLVIDLPLHFFSPVLNRLIEANPGREPYANSVYVSTQLPRHAFKETTEKVLRRNHDIARENGAPLTDDYVLWEDEIEVKGKTYRLAGWFEAV